MPSLNLTTLPHCDLRGTTLDGVACDAFSLLSLFKTILWVPRRPRCHVPPDLQPKMTEILMQTDGGKAFRDILAAGTPVVFDGGMGTSLYEQVTTDQMGIRVLKAAKPTVLKHQTDRRLVARKNC